MRALSRKASGTGIDMMRGTAVIWVLVLIGAALLLAAGGVLLRYVVGVLADRRTLRYQSDLLQKHCEEVQNMYRQTRGWRHDYHNHIQTMKAHLAMGKLEELETYLNELDHDLTTVDTVIKTGNVMVDAILNSKISVAASKGIAVEAKAVVPEKLDTSLSEVDCRKPDGQCHRGLYEDAAGGTAFYPCLYRYPERTALYLYDKRNRRESEKGGRRLSVR